ncbi:MAG TPA: extracellular solute-binding protein [Symbiobacteriaceae bacterium]|nr:extracellular solute-binding protein [Symbiobacteriaceae bacterium]
MSRLRKRLCGVLTASLLFSVSLAGCAKPQEPEKPAYKGPLTLWAAPGLAGIPATKPDQAWFEERARDYTAAHPDTPLTVRLFASPEELEQSLLTSAELPDLAFSRFLPELAPRLGDLREAPAQGEAFYPNAPGGFTRDGKTMGLPVLLELQVLALNEQAFAEAGVALPAGGKWNYETFENTLKELSSKDRYGLGFYHLPGYHEWWSLAEGLITAEGKVAAGAEEGLARLARYRSEGLLFPDTGKLKAEETWSAFASSPAGFAILPVSTWALPLLREEPYNAKLSVAGFPGGHAAGRSYGFLLSRQADSLKFQAAAQAARFMAAPDQQVRLARDTGLMPASPGAGNPFDGDPLLSGAYQFAPTFWPLPAGPAWDKAEPMVSRELTYGVLGARAPADVLAGVEKAISAAVAPANP